MRTVYIGTFSGGWKPLNKSFVGLVHIAEAVQDIEAEAYGKFSLGKNNITSVMVAKMLRRNHYPTKYRVARK
jgi:hypothetical protein